MKHRTLKLRRVTAAAVLGLGMSAAVIGITAGVAGATTPTDTAIGTPPTVTSTSAAYTAAGVSIALGTGAIGTAQVFTVPLAASTSGTADWSSATVTEDNTVAGTTTPATLAHTGTGTTALTFTVPATTTATNKHTIKITPDKLTNHAAHGAIKASPSSATYTGGAAVTIANAPAASSTGNSITPTSAPTVPSTGNANPAGSLTVHLHGNGAKLASTLTLTATPTSGTSSWHTATVSSTGITASGTANTTNVLTITLGTLATGASATIHVTGVTYNTVTAKGTITVTPRWSTGTAFTPANAVNAVSSTPMPPTAPNSVTVTATSSPAIGVGQADQPVGTQTLTITGTHSATKGWAAGTKVKLHLHATTAACTRTAFVAYDGAPKVAFTATSSKGLSTTPTVTDSVSTATCVATKTITLTITLTNAVTLKKTAKATAVTPVAVFTITGEHYTTGAKDAAGAVSVTSSPATATNEVLLATVATASNAVIAKSYVTTTPVTLAQGSLDQPIKPVDVVESVAGSVSKGYVCVTASTGTFVKSSTASAKVASGNGVVAKTVTYPSSTTAAFDVTTASSATKPSTYVLSGLYVNAPTAPNTTVNVTVKQGANATCVGGTNLTVPTAAIYTTQAVPQQIYGQTADATAAKLLESRFPANNATACPGGTSAVHPVVLATTANFPDALSSQYLAGHLNTGTLLTPTAKLSTVTLQALHTEGITNVYVIGGPLAVSTTVVNQLETTPIYNCGGIGQVKVNGTTQYLQVTRIYGETQYDTAQAVAQSVPTGNIASLSLVGSYAGVNATGGMGKYNQTKGLASAAPSSAAALPTAIVASGVHFQDAMSASAMAYKTIATNTTYGLPVLLSTTTKLPTATKAAIADLGIKQVILMGGQLAVTNTVEKALASLGVSVLRIAGATYTETATDLATFELNETTGGLGLGWIAGHTGTTGGTVTVSRGNGFTDGLAGAVISGFHQEPLVLTQTPTTVGPYLTTFLKEAGKTGAGIGTATAKKHLSTLVVFGGPLAVSPAAISAMETDLQH